MEAAANPIFAAISPANVRCVDCTHPIVEGSIGWPTNPTGGDDCRNLSLNVYGDNGNSFTEHPDTPEGMIGKPKPDSRFTVACRFRVYNAGNDLGTGFRKDLWTMSCDCGTHMDSPSHFKPGGRTITEIPLDQLVCPAVVVDVSAKCAANTDYKLTVQDLEQWEARHGRIPAGAFVCMKTGWASKFGTPEYAGFEDDDDLTSTMHFPGFSGDAAGWLYSERDDIKGIGIDTCSLDSGNSTVDRSGHSIAGAAPQGQEYVALADAFPAHFHSLVWNDKYQLENMVLDEVPESGATFISLPLKVKDSPESLTRVLALCPK